MKSNKSTNYIMGELAYKKAIWKLALPSIASFLVLSLYITIDRLMISNFVGPKGLAAIQYFQPALNLVLAVLVAIGVGTKTLVSIYLGRKDEKSINQTISNGLKIIIIAGIFIALFMFLFGSSIPSWFGASGEIATMSGFYFIFFSFGVLPQTFVFFCENIFTTKGYTKIILLFTIISQITNLSLDYIFMAILKMGIKGAALATVISMLINFILFVLTIIFVKKEFLINPFRYKLFSKNSKKIIKLGFPASISQTIIAIKFILINILLSSFNNPDLIIVYSATMAIISVFFIPFFGFSSATVPMMGFSYGAKKYLRLKKIWLYKVRFSTLYFILFIILIWLFPSFWLGIFNASNFALSEIIPRIITSGLWLLPLSISYGFLFQSIGNARESLFIELIRNILIFIPVVLFLRLFNDPIILFLAFPITDFIGVGVVWLLIRTTFWKRLHKDLIKSWKNKKLEKRIT